MGPQPVSPHPEGVRPNLWMTMLHPCHKLVESNTADFASSCAVLHGNEGNRTAACCRDKDTLIRAQDAALSVTFCCCSVRLLGGPSFTWGARRSPYRLSANVDDELASDCLSKRAVTRAKSSSSQSSNLWRIGLRWANTCRA